MGLWSYEIGEGIRGVGFSVVGLIFVRRPGQNRRENDDHCEELRDVLLRRYGQERDDVMPPGINRTVSAASLTFWTVGGFQVPWRMALPGQ